jgi:hypothetical protein
LVLIEELTLNCWRQKVSPRRGIGGNFCAFILAQRQYILKGRFELRVEIAG